MQLSASRGIDDDDGAVGERTSAEQKSTLHSLWVGVCIDSDLGRADVPRTTHNSDVCLTSVGQLLSIGSLVPQSVFR